MSRFHRPRVQIDGDNLRHLYLHVGMMEEREAQVEGYIAGGERRRGHLVKQWLKLMIVVLIKQSDADIWVRGQPAGTIQSRETAAYDHDMLHGLRIVFSHHESRLSCIV